MRPFHLHSRTVLLLAGGFAVLFAAAESAVIDLRAAAVSQPAGTGSSDTGRLIELEICGDGYFIVQDVEAPGGFIYTRNGRITQNCCGQLMIADYILDPPICIPPDATSVNVACDGTVTYRVPEWATPVEAGQIQLARLTSECLIPCGDAFHGLYDGTLTLKTGSPGTDGLGTLRLSPLDRIVRWTTSFRSEASESPCCQ